MSVSYVRFIARTFKICQKFVDSLELEISGNALQRLMRCFPRCQAGREILSRYFLFHSTRCHGNSPYQYLTCGIWKFELSFLVCSHVIMLHSRLYKEYLLDFRASSSKTPVKNECC
jgi:hypothetical protein